MSEKMLQQRKSLMAMANNKGNSNSATASGAVNIGSILPMNNNNQGAGQPQQQASMFTLAAAASNNQGGSSGGSGASMISLSKQRMAAQQAAAMQQQQQQPGPLMQPNMMMGGRPPPPNMMMGMQQQQQHHPSGMMGPPPSIMTPPTSHQLNVGGRPNNNSATTVTSSSYFPHQQLQKMQQPVIGPPAAMRLVPAPAAAAKPPSLSLMAQRAGAGCGKPGLGSLSSSRASASGVIMMMMGVMKSSPPTPILGIRCDATSLEESFDDYHKPIRSKKRKESTVAKQISKKKMKISIPSLKRTVTNDSLPSSKKKTSAKPDAVKASTEAFKSKPKLFARPLIVGEVSPLDEDPHSLSRFEQEALEDSLRFLEETHEEQDPAHGRFERQKRQAEIARQLEQFNASFEQERKEIDEFITEQLRQRKAENDKTLQEHKLRAANEESRDSQRLEHLYQQKTASNNKKIAHALNLLRMRHSRELEESMQRHRQHAQQRRLADHMAQAEWQSMSKQIMAKQQRQIQEFTQKGDEAKKKTEAEYHREQDKIRKQREQRLRDIEQNRQKLGQKLMTNAQLTRQRYLKRHFQRTMKKKEEYQAQLAALKAEEEGINADDAMTTPATGSLGNPMHSNQALSSSMRSTGSTASNRTAASGMMPSPGSSQHPLNVAKTAMKEKEELRLPSPIQSTPDWLPAKEETRKHERAGAPARHKHRKGVMSHHQNRQLTVELHNEGLWIMVHGPQSAAKDSNSRDSSKGDANIHNNEPVVTDEEFVPWGSKAHSILESIVCGEIPQGRYSRIDYGESQILQGGQIRCCLSDLRTSQQTASQQRAVSYREQEEANLIELEQKQAQMSKMALEAEKAAAKSSEDEQMHSNTLEAATKEHKKALSVKDEFMSKFQSYIGPDGNVINTPNPNDRQKLQEALMGVKRSIEQAKQKEANSRQALSDIKSRVSKLQAVAKGAQKKATSLGSTVKSKKLLMSHADNPGKKASKQVEAAEIERSATRCRDTIGAFKRAADKRRQAMNDKKNNGNASSAWAHSFPNLSNPLKKSLWHKLHRRNKQFIILRPTEESMLNELRYNIVNADYKLKQQQQQQQQEPDSAGSTSADANSNSSPAEKYATAEEKLLKAEQMFLLAMHPAAKEPVQTVPGSKSTEAWGEPGWLLNLYVPPAQEAGNQGILPCRSSFPVLEKSISEMASAPGRQAASLLREPHFRCLASPLSAVGVASSPAETIAATAVAASSQGDGIVDGDPLQTTEAAEKLGYNFKEKLASGTKQSQGRRKSATQGTDGGDGSSGVVGEPGGKVEAMRKKQQQRQQQQGDGSSKADNNDESKADGARPKPERRKSGSKRRTSKTVGSGKQGKGALSKLQQQTDMSTQPQPPPQQQHQQQQGQLPPQPNVAQQQKQFGRPQSQQHGPPGALPQQGPSPGAQYWSPQQQRQMAQLRMMQQQATASGGVNHHHLQPHHPNNNFTQQAAMSQLQQQFYAPLNPPPGGGMNQFAAHQQAQQQQQAMNNLGARSMPGRPGLPMGHQQQQHPQNMVGSPQQQQGHGRLPGPNAPGGN